MTQPRVSSRLARQVAFASALALGFAASVLSTPAEAQKPGGKPAPKATVAAVATEPAAATKAIAHGYAGVTWGKSSTDVIAAVNKIIDEDFRLKRKDVLPGPRLTELENEQEEQKKAFKRTLVTFGKTPTAWDSSSIAGEFTYDNKESLLELERNNKKTYFFFIQDKLWKIIEERTYSTKKAAEAAAKDPKAAKLATDFDTLHTNLEAALGVKGRDQAAAADKGRKVRELDWKDGTSHLRALDRGAKDYSIAYVESATEAKLDTLRPNKPAAKPAVDPSISDALRGAPPPPAPPASATKPKK
jgi:hypothetical protein